MRFEIVGKNGFELTDTIRDYAQDKLEKLAKYFSDSDETDCRVVCKVYKEGHKVEVTIPLHNMILRAEVMADDMYAAIDLSLDKLEGQIRKYKTKQGVYTQERDAIGEIFETGADTKGISAKFEAQKLVKTKNVSLTEMTRDEAIDQMDLLGHPFFVFLDKETKRTNVVYLREDFDYGIIETE